MYVSSIHVQGLRGAEEFEATKLDRVVELPAGPSGIAVMDALSLFAASLDKNAMAPTLVRLGLLRDPAALEMVEEDGFPVQITLPDAFGVPSLLPVDGSRQVTITVDVALDPPLFGRLRGLAVRDPRLVTALGEGAKVSIKVGWLFTNDLVTASVGVLGVMVGDSRFQATGGERPAWLPPLLHDLGARFARVGWDGSDVARRLLDAALSQDPDRRGRFAKCAEILVKPPWLLGRLELVRVGDQVEACFGPGLMRARQFGPAAAEALRLVEAVVLDGPDVLLVESPGIAQGDPAAVRGWLDLQASGEQATIEQVVVAYGGSAGEPEGIA